MSRFYNLENFAAKLGTTRQTAAKRISRFEYPAFKRGNSYSIPQCALHLGAIKEYEQQNFSDGVPPMTFMIGNHKGGTGKTTATINIAASLAFFGYKVLIIDADTQGNASTINKLHMKEDFSKHNLTRLLLEMRDMDKEKLDKRLKKAIFSVESPYFTQGSLDIIPNSLDWDMEKERLFTYPNAENMLNRLLRHVKDQYNFIIIDTHPSMDVMWRMSVMASDAIIIGLKPEQYSIEGLGGVYERIYMLNDDYQEIKGHNIEVLGTIVTDFKRRTNIANINVEVIKESLEQFTRYNDAIVLEPYISHSVKAAEQQTLRGPIMFDDPTSDMSAEYLEVSKNIIYQLYKLQSIRS